MTIQRPKVGVGVIAYNPKGEFLLYQRINTHGADCWGFPGGHLEFGESVEECARREVMEESGLEVSDLKPLTFTNDIFEKENLHYITIFVTCNIKEGEPENKEPHKCKGWQWSTWDNLPQPLFLPIENLLKQNLI